MALSINKIVFLSFVVEILVITSFIIKFINELENKNNIKIVYNIPYCPEFNPVEHIIGLIKKYIINHNIKEKSHIVKLLNTSIMQIKNKIYKNCFTNSIKKLNS